MIARLAKRTQIYPLITVEVAPFRHVAAALFPWLMVPPLIGGKYFWQHTMHSKWFGFALVLAGAITMPALAQVPDAALQVYGVNVVKTPPFKKQFTGYGIYMGQGRVLTAAHVVGHWPFFTHPRVLVAGQDLPAKVVKQRFAKVDLALLSIDESRLPISLRLRRNQLCKTSPPIGTEVVDVLPQATSRAHIISPTSISSALQGRFDSLIDTPKLSGTGIFDPERQCLLGIVSEKAEKYDYQMQNGHAVWAPDGFAGYFVSVAKITKFLPKDLQF